MKRVHLIAVAALILFGVAAAGYTLGKHAPAVPEVHSDTGGTERKLLYYRNPMGLPDTSPVPKKDAMGMDYVPVYQGEEASAPSAAAGQIQISVEKVQKMGVKTEAVSLRMLDKTVNTAGRVEASERQIYNISPKFEGWIEKLHVSTTGQPVKKGQPLFDVYSPELVSAQREYAIAAQGELTLRNADDDARRSMKQLADASLLRLKNWDISAQQVQDLTRSGTTRRSLTFYSPANGIVMEKKALQGMRFMPGEMLYQIADLSSVWVVADVYEQDIALVKTGARAVVKINAYPDRQFDAVVAYVYPTLNAATRTVAVRLEIANPDGLLKPGMFAQVEIPVSSKDKVLAVPASAVIDSGTRQIVLVQRSEGRFEPREVKLGGRDENYVAVLDGVAEGDRVVTSANFLIDAESNLKAALVGMGGADGKLAGAAGDRSKSIGQEAQGILNSINPDGTVSITHEPIKTLGWPGMTMDFQLANSSLAQGIKPGTAISFELVERKPGDYVITKLQAKPSAAHEGH